MSDLIIDLPADDIASSMFRLDHYQAVQESAFTRRAQVQSFGGGTLDRWAGVLTTVELDMQGLRRWRAFFAQLHGVAGRFWLGDPDYQPHEDLAALSIITDGPPPSMYQLTVNGFTAASSGLLKAGDYVAVGGELKILTEDVVADQTGAAVLTFQPGLRLIPASGTALELMSPRAVMRLQAPVDISTDVLSAPISFAFVEDI